MKEVRGDVYGEEREGKEGYKRVLWNCLNRYYKVGTGEGCGGKGLTLFVAHANGFPKEIWEPTLRYLLATSADMIDEIWVWESVQHGDSALVNGARLSCLFDWMDNARDILNFFTFFVPSKASSSVLPLHLPRVPAAESEQRQLHGLPGRTIVAIGHSYGGCTSTLAALTNPKLFSSLILVDPVLVKPLRPTDPKGHTDGFILGALSRREVWSSKEEALDLFKKSPFFSAWHPEAIKVYVECGLYDTTDPQTGRPITQLKMPGLQEAVVFVEIHTESEVYHRVKDLDVNITLRWVMPGVEDPGEFGPPQQRVWLRPTNTSNIRISNAGHLIVQEVPQELANDISGFLQIKYPFMRKDKRERSKL
ncbi:hypothetical protein AMATHDRAFT_10265 [Amanita thiersii Skay4041]|uniref:AB hydrolase-1 domain-containing protein n=1 Tax=Amanita thiersii Skay4041 TaxID=703135 RepID=A0A2A9N6V6_9AGAR|nr:hypothetical protein AMATHDRAFT_10265 [Amanita thiersii Skay4041]